MADQASLIFLPDISGFTNFVNATAVEHSQHIIAELLETLIDSQQLGLTLAEIEGDAIFYYKHEEVPSPKDLMAQARKMFIDFHNHLSQYEHNRICDCGACSTASQLTVKFIAHAGRMDFINIKKERKPYGKEVIVAHRLMKNDVPVDDYLLISQGVFDAWKQEKITDENELTAIEGCSEYEVGKVPYQYFKLAPLLKYVTPPLPFTAVPESNPFVKISGIIDKPQEDLFELITNFNLRHLWNKDVDRMEFQENRVNRVGEKHVCVIDNKSIEFETVTKNLGPGKKVYGEHTKDIPLIKEITTYFIVEKQDQKSQLTIEAHPQNLNFFKKLILPVFKGPFMKNLRTAFENIKNAAETPAKVEAT